MNNDQTTWLPHYEQVAEVLYWLTDGHTVAHIHGMLCAHVCTSRPFVSEGWVSQQMQQQVGRSLLQPASDLSLQQQSQSLLTRLFDISHSQLSGQGFDFELLMPDDDTELDLRVLALGDWCQGFYSTFSSAQMITSHFSEEAREALSYLSQVTEVELGDLHEADEAEMAWVEVSEYIRMAIVLIFIESQEITATMASAQIH